MYVMAHQREAPTDTTELMTRLTWFTLPGNQHNNTEKKWVSFTLGFLTYELQPVIVFL